MSQRAASSQPHRARPGREPSAAGIASDESAPARGWWVPLAVVGIVAGAARLVTLLEIRAVGFFERPLSDGAVYLDRARGIAAGNWVGPPDFVLAPLYAYVVGLLHGIGLDGAWSIRFMQIAFGITTCLLVMDLSRRLFGRAAAVFSGLLVALLPSAIFFDLIVQKTSLAMVLAAGTLWSLHVATQRPTATRWIGVGALLGLLVLTRQNALMLVPFVLAWIALGVRAVVWPRRMALATVLLAGIAVVVAPWVIRNQLVLGRPVLTTPNLGQNFAMGNHPEATGTYLPAERGRATGEREQAAWARAAERAAGRTLSAGEVSDYYLRTALEYIVRNPIEWLTLCAKKALLVINAYELPDTEDYYLYGERSFVLRALDIALHAGVVFPLAAVGIVLTWRARRRLWLLYGWIVVLAISTAAFMVFARYRMPIVLGAAPLAGAGLAALIAAARQGAYRRVAIGVLTGLAVGVLSNLPIHAARAPQPFSYVNHAVALADLQRHDEALAQLDRALAIEPDHIDALWVRASVLADLGRLDEAAATYERVIEMEPVFAAAWRGLGVVQMRRDRIDRAEANLQRAIDLEPLDSQTLDRMAQLAMRRGETDRALRLLERAAALVPRDASLQINLGNVLLALGRIDKAEDAYGRGRRLKPWSVEAMTNLGAVAAARREWERAERHYQAALRHEPGFPVARDGYVESLLRQRKFDAAAEFLRGEINAGRRDDRVRSMLEGIDALQRDQHDRGDG